MNEQIARKLLKARSTLLFEHCFFGALAMRLELVEEPSIKTLAVDGERIFYNPDFIATLNAPLLKAAVAHEVGHCIFSHIGRRGARDRHKWNCAGDYVINDMLKESGLTIGEGWLYEPAYKGMTADQIYNLLPDSEDEGGGSGSGNGGGEPLCDILDGSPNADHKKRIERDWQIATAQAAQAAKAAGQLSGALKRFIDELAEPQVDWRDVLRRFVTETAKEDYNWMRPNRRYLSSGFYLPSLHSEAMGEIVVFVDTSGSIDNRTLTAFASEINSIKEDTAPNKVHVVYVDAEVAGADEFGPDEPVVINPRGGGGTDFRPAFKWVAKHGLNPAAAVYLTDMYGPFPKEEAPYPTLWCATSDQVAPWGETIRIKL